jgi:hypothetical protein
MKDEALRNSIQITAQSYAARGDHDGDLICRVLKSIIDGALILDAAMLIGAESKKSKSK